MQTHASVIVHASAEHIFAFIADPANDRRWRGNLIASLGTIERVGDRVTQTYSYQGRTQTVEVEVSEYEPPFRLAYRLTKPLHIRLAFTVQSDGDGSRVTAHVSGTVPGPAAIFAGRILTEVTKQAKADLARLKHAIESETT